MGILINDLTPRDQHTAIAAQTLFAYTFPIEDDDDLVVKKEDSAGTITTEAKGTDYTVAGVGDANGGTITLTSGATAGDIYTLYRDMAIDRLTDFTTGGDFEAETVNDELDEIVMMMQQLERDLARTVRLPITDQLGTFNELADKGDRSGQLFGFTADGQPALFDPATDPTLPSATGNNGAHVRVNDGGTAYSIDTLVKGTATRALEVTATGTADFAIEVKQSGGGGNRAMILFDNNRTPLWTIGADDTLVGLNGGFGIIDSQADQGLRIENSPLFLEMVSDASADTMEWRISAAAGTETIFNERGQDIDFRIESDGSPNMVMVDAGLNLIGIDVAPTTGNGLLQLGNPGTEITTHVALGIHETGVGTDEKMFLKHAYRSTVSTSDVNIIECGNRSGLIIVAGGDAGLAVTFTDLVMFRINGDPEVVHSGGGVGSPGTRTYTRSSGFLQCRLSSGTLAFKCMFLQVTGRI